MSAGLGEPVDEAAAAIVEAIESDWWASISEPVLEILGHENWVRRSAMLDALRATRAGLTVAGLQGSQEADREREAAAAEWTGRISRLQADGTVTAAQVRQLAESLRQRLREAADYPPEPGLGALRDYEWRRSGPASPGTPPAPTGPYQTDETAGPPGTTFGDDDDDD